MPKHKLTGKRYDAAQTEALRQRDLFVDSILSRVATIRRESGNLDVVADCLDDILRDAKRAQYINSDLQVDNVTPYDVEIVTCERCARKYKAYLGCVCKG